jgi:uncharacterized membrane protein YfcA
LLMDPCVSAPIAPPACQALRVSPIDAVILVAAGIVAGIIGSGGGVSSLVSYPALLAVGVPPLPANVANLVAGISMGPGSALSSRGELAESRAVLLHLLPAVVLGTVIGAGLLLVTPAPVFARLVPFLVAAGSVVLIVQPVLRRLNARRAGPGALQLLLIAAVSVYGGYFGAGSGIMLLAVILVVVDSRFQIANAIKNVLLGGISLVASVVFVATGPVLWSAVIPLAGGLLIGSALGPIIVRRVPSNLVRWVAAAFGLALALYLWLRPT